MKDARKGVRRRAPKWAEVRPLLQVHKPELSPTRRRLAAANTVQDLRHIARRTMPRSVFDYVDGGAEQELSIERARTAFNDVEFSPRILRNVAAVDTTVDILGEPATLPLVLAPTGFTRMMHHQGELAVAAAAARAGVPYTLSTMGTTSLEDVRASQPAARQWFQVYLWKDRDRSIDLIARAATADYEALLLTVDTPVGGARIRDARNGLTIPPSLTVKTIAGMAVHPSWWANLLTTEPLTFASLSSFNGTVEQLIGKMFDPTVQQRTWRGCEKRGLASWSSREFSAPRTLA